jgi:lipopolysaccharide export system permease protein
MCILDHYILKKFLAALLACIFIFLFLYIIVDIFGHLDEIIKQKTSLNLLKRYYLYYLPIIFVQVCPIACLLACIFTLSGLNRHNEIIAMRSSGLSIFQITRPLIITACIITTFVFLINEKMVSGSYTLLEQLKQRMQTQRQNKPEQVIENLSVYGSNNRLFFVNKFFPARNEMEGITILQQDNRQNITKKIIASKGVWRQGIWRFYQCITYEYDENGQIKKGPRYLEKEIMDIWEEPQDFLLMRQQPESMSIEQLQKYIRKFSMIQAQKVANNLRIDLYQRFTLPLTNFVIIILGIPFALKTRRRATILSSFGISFIMGFLYYTANALSIAFGKAGILSPFVSASLAHFLFLTTGLYITARLP